MARRELIDHYQSIIITEEKKQTSYQGRVDKPSFTFKRLSYIIKSILD